MAMAPSSRMTELEPEVGGRIGLRRHFTTAGVHPYDQVSWARRTSRITNYRDGSVAFEQPDVEVPTSWSLNATNILAQKYFRGAPGTPERETSLRQVADRVVDTITAWGRRDGYFADEEEAEAFADELKYLIITQRGAFNSPVWFNIGAQGRKQQASACQPYHALVSTPDGLVPIGRLVEEQAIGAKVFDAHGLTRVVAVKANGAKPVLRLHAKAGHTLDVTPDHLVWKATGETSGRFVEAGTLGSGDQLEWCRTESWGAGEITSTEIAEAALAGWLQSDGFVGRSAEGTNRSLTMEAMTVTDAELEWVDRALDAVFPGVHRHQRSVETKSTELDCRRTRLCGEALGDFVERWSLLARRMEMKVPPPLHRAPLPVVAAYLRSIFQAEGYVFEREASAGIGMDMVSEDVVRGVQALLTRFGIFSRVRFKADARAKRVGCWSLTIRSLGDRRRFADEIGFVDPAKAISLMMTLELSGHPERASKRLEIERVEQLGEMEVYDIQTESGEYLSGGLRVHNCFILSVDDTMDSILNWYVEEGTIFKGGSGAGVNLSRIRSSAELLKGGGTASGPVSFMRGADASAGTIKSGGATRRAAKMVILNADHPDIEDFVWCKATEERKARVLREAGFDMDLDGKDSHSTQYQNANNSVRVTDEFMQAVVDDADWHLRAVTSGEVVRTVKARDLMHQISQATWECADPGMQFDTTINRWHTAAATGRINGSNPCSEYMHLDNSACNLASINLLAFLDEEENRFDVAGYQHAVELFFTAQEILVGNADYPTEAIAETSRRFRQLGLGYANLGALLMALGLAYDSDGGRAWAGALTAVLTGHAYATSARTAARMGPFAGYHDNQEHMLEVLRMHRHEVASIDVELVPADLLGAARADWDAAVSWGEAFGVRNSQASVIAPTGTIGLLLDCDTTGLEPDLGLCKMKKLVGGGTMTIVNQTVPRALRRLGYTSDQVDAIVAYIDEHKTILGAPSLAAEHVPVFACSMGDNPIHYNGHIRMMSAIQPFISGALSKTVNMPEEVSVEEVEQLHIDAWKLGIKAIAIYRDNCKVAQPLSMAKKEIKPEELAAAIESAPATVVERIVEKVVKEPVRQKLPRNRRSRTFEFRVADCKGFVTVGEYDDGRPGELFLRVSKQGSTLAGIMDAFAISVSHGLQYGVPLKAFIEAFTNMRFEPAGMTDDADIRFASSLLDYIFRRLAVDYLPLDERMELGILSVGERHNPTLPGIEESVTETVAGQDLATSPPPHNTQAADLAPLTEMAPAASASVRPANQDAPYCMQCGVQMVRAGSCHACPSCGSTSGCS
ncbi:MAG TPA: vitamin B12-dependent ribonucleotide reductase [Acidimicrobiales bacterium]|jgi:ribonucleoside-diphosphate reductase alpha chain|nr:vitamin B12-dependent ribonucleotide reductase [Acidimicrobiales bacterium]